MKHNKILMLIAFSMLIFLVSCGNTTGQNHAVSGSVVSGSAMSEEQQTEKSEEIADIKTQLNFLVEKRDRWLLENQTEWCDYGVTDFDQNGKLEICRVKYDEDKGYRNTFWEVNEQNGDLEEIRQDKSNRQSWLIDTDDGYGIGYYEQGTDTYHYVRPRFPADYSDLRCLDMTKSGDKMDIRTCSDSQNLLASGRKFYYRIEWFGRNEDEDADQELGEMEGPEDELYQKLLQSAQEFRICYSDEMGEEVQNPYFPYHEQEQTVTMQITWRDYEGITGEMVYTIYKVAVGMEGTLYFIDDTDVKNVIETKTGKEKPQSWWGGRLNNRAREYLWVTEDEIYLVEDFNNVVNPGQNDFGRLLFDNEIHDTAICICDKNGNSPELPLKRRHAWEKNVGLTGYRCYGEEWCNYKMQQKGYEPF